MKLTKSLLGITAMTGLVLSPIAGAKDYQHEISYQKSTIGLDNNVDLSIGQFSYIYYLDKVDTSNKPLAEAAYLDRARSVEISLYDELVEYADGSDKPGSGLWIEYIHMDKNSPLLFEVVYSPVSHESRTSSGTTVFEYDQTMTEFTAGWFVSQTTAIAATISKTEYTFTPSGYSIYDYDTTDIYLEAKTIMLNRNNPINLHGKIVKMDYGDDANTLLSIEGDYYLDNMKSVGAIYQMESGDQKDIVGSTMGVRGRYFFTEKLSLHAGFESFSASDSSGDDYTATELELYYRF